MLSDMTRYRYLVFSACVFSVDTVGWASGRASGLEKMSDEMTGFTFRVPAYSGCRGKESV